MSRFKRPSEDVNPDCQEFFRICPEIFQHVVQFPRRPRRRIVQRGVYQKLSQRALSRIYFVDSQVDLIQSGRNLISDFVACQQLSRRALTLV